MRPKLPKRPGQKGHRPFHAKLSEPRSGARPKPGTTDPRPPRPERRDRPANTGNWLYGLHAVRAALVNPRRKLGRALLTPRAAETIGEKPLSRVRVEILDSDAIAKVLPAGAVHQGAALEVQPLPRLDIDMILTPTRNASHSDLPLSGGGKRRIVLVLDQISDPHNVGAILRTAAAFGAAAVVVQDRNAPPQSGALAKAASGALDLIAYVEVVNIARALDRLADHGFWRIALAGDGEQSIAEALPAGDLALVLGSEGTGIRRLVRERCEAAAFIPIAGAIQSLNVSNAAAIALYEARR